MASSMVISGTTVVRRAGSSGADAAEGRLSGRDVVGWDGGDTSMGVAGCARLTSFNESPKFILEEVNDGA